MPIVTLQDLPGLVGSEIGVSDWITVDQERINAFADITEDHQFIHIDPERARNETPFGGTIAHGFLTLSLLSALAANVAIAIDGVVMGINYGFERVRFLTPVPAGGRIRGRFSLSEAVDKGDGRWMLRYGVSIEIEGVEKPALAAEWLTMQMVGS